MKIAMLYCFIYTLLVLSGLADAQQVTIYTEEFPPFNFTEKGKITGVSAEVVQHVMAGTGIDYQIKSLPWEQAYGLALKESNTLIFSISRTSSRESLFKWIGILTPTTYSVMGLKSRSDIKINSLEDLKRYKIGTTKDDIVESWLIDNGFSPTELLRSSGEHAALKNFKNLLNNRIDLWPFPDAVAYYIVRQQGHSNPESLLIKVFALEELSGGYYIAASLNTRDSIVSEVSDALMKFKLSDDYFKILAHWSIDAMGMKTDAPIAKLIYVFKNFNRIVTVGYLATDKISAHRHGGLYRKEIREEFVEEYVSSFNQWREKYTQLQDKVDALIIGDVSGIQGWDDKAARRTVQSRTNIPTGCARGELTDYAMFGYDADDFVINKSIAGNLKKPIPKSCIDKAVRIIERPRY